MSERLGISGRLALFFLDSPLTPLMGQVFDTDTATQDWFAEPDNK